MIDGGFAGSQGAVPRPVAGLDIIESDWAFSAARRRGISYDDVHERTVTGVAYCPVEEDGLAKGCARTVALFGD